MMMEIEKSLLDYYSLLLNLSHLLLCFCNLLLKHYHRLRLLQLSTRHPPCSATFRLVLNPLHLLLDRQHFFLILHILLRDLHHFCFNFDNLLLLSKLQSASLKRSRKRHAGVAKWGEAAPPRVGWCINMVGHLGRKNTAEVWGPAVLPIYTP